MTTSHRSLLAAPVVFAGGMLLVHTVGVWAFYNHTGGLLLMTAAFLSFFGLTFGWPVGLLLVVVGLWKKQRDMLIAGGLNLGFHATFFAMIPFGWAMTV